MLVQWLLCRQITVTWGQGGWCWWILHALTTHVLFCTFHPSTCLPFTCAHSDHSARNSEIHSEWHTFQWCSDMHWKPWHSTVLESLLFISPWQPNVGIMFPATAGNITCYFPRICGDIGLTLVIMSGPTSTDIAAIAHWSLFLCWCCMNVVSVTNHTVDRTH